MTDATLAHCDGCDDMQEDVQAYVALFTDSNGWERVEYCPDCYDLARAKQAYLVEDLYWNGETDERMGL